MKLEFIPAADMKRIWSLRWAIATAIIAAIPVAYITLPSDWLPAIPDWFKAVCAYAVLLTAAVTASVRVIKQPHKDS